MVLTLSVEDLSIDRLTRSSLFRQTPPPLNWQPKSQLAERLDKLCSQMAQIINQLTLLLETILFEESQRLLQKMIFFKIPQNASWWPLLPSQKILLCFYQAPCKWAGKDYATCFGWQVLLATYLHSRLFFLTRTSDCHLLVNPGTDVSVFPPIGADQKNRQELGLRAVNGSPIVTYGTQSLTLKMGLQWVFRWIFNIADISIPISTPTIGTDFLTKVWTTVNLNTV